MVPLQLMEVVEAMEEASGAVMAIHLDPEANLPGGECLEASSIWL